MIDLNYTFVIQLLNFIILLLVLERVIYRPILSFLKERQQSQDDCHRAAESDRAEVEKIKVEYMAMLSGARKQAHQIQAEMVGKAEVEVAGRISQVREIQKARMAEDRASLEQDKQRAREELKKEISHLAGALVSRVTRTTN